ncbi:hypothetical protein [Streptomyces candidus]|uniref:PH domain-containing protein n=1 Tax=Streptomyces candidus TaxID=67283 RepID=A0A7X0LSN7_9ACTN|nr:hypothetical protein [Streptomyces candidus]MBB6439873.1 hypothetical protein [Streptomyces candidus]
MADTWISFDAASRRKHWWMALYLTIIFSAMEVAISLSAREPFWLIIIIGSLWLFSIAHVINRGYGRSLLTADRILFRTFISRRSVPWGEVVRVEKRSHYTRGGYWWNICLVREQGRALPIPGAFTSKEFDRIFEGKFNLIQEYWSRSVGSD